MKLYTRERGALRAVAFDENSTQEKALELLNVKHLVLRELKGVGVHPDKKAPVLLVIQGDKVDYVDPRDDGPQVA
ncbi:hypothetical protein [Citrobacter phage Ci1]|nr:hypothetical protein [Citrobacter phage Ci1]